MRYENGVLTLSRRNLLALLHKLDKPSSSRTLVKNCLDENLTIRHIIIKAEDDQAHYQGETPGAMTEDTEAFIKKHGGLTK